MSSPASSTKSTTAFSAESEDVTVGNVFECSKLIYDQVREIDNQPQPSEDDLHHCMRAIHKALTDRGRKYYFFGGICCKLLAFVPRSTADIDVVIENCSMALPNPRDWLADEPFFWSNKHKQYVFVTIRDDKADTSNPDILWQGRRFVEIDINPAGWGSFPTFDKIGNGLVALPKACGISLSREELLKLKMAGWHHKSRREGPKKHNDCKDVVALYTVMYMQSEFLDTNKMNAEMKDGLRMWIREFGDDDQWRNIGVLLQKV